MAEPDIGPTFGTVTSSAGTGCGNGPVELGVLVTVRWADGDPEPYLYLDPRDAPAGSDVISPTSSLGARLVGACVGDEIQYEHQGVVQAVSVVGVSPPPQPVVAPGSHSRSPLPRP